MPLTRNWPSLGASPRSNCRTQPAPATRRVRRHTEQHTPNAQRAPRALYAAAAQTAAHVRSERAPLAKRPTSWQRDQPPKRLNSRKTWVVVVTYKERFRAGRLPQTPLRLGGPLTQGSRTRARNLNTKHYFTEEYTPQVRLRPVQSAHCDAGKPLENRQRACAQSALHSSTRWP